MKTMRYILAGLFTLTAIYLFASAPPPLVDGTALAGQAREIEAAEMFQAVNAINAAARLIYTRQIVGGGVKAGLKFGEDWQDTGVEKGPLPALFLRMVAAELERRPPRLGLYLGSDAPINKSNLFTGPQAVIFARLRAEGSAQFGQIDGTGAIAMFPDPAVAQPCVTCHNDHPDSPRSDWVMHEIMGATTWTWPTARVGAADYLDAAEATFASVRAAYQSYLDRAGGFGVPPQIGTTWPAEGSLSLPDVDTFMAAVRAAAAEPVFAGLVLREISQ